MNRRLGAFKRSSAAPASKNVAIDLKLKQEYDNANVYFQRKNYVTEDLLYRLSLWAELQGHTGCVNCLQWNEKGTILASGSDDYRVILWDPFSKRQLHTIQTGHINNIFSVQFAPEKDDHIIITGAGDSKVRVHDILSSSGESIHVYGCHFARVKRVVVTPTESNLFWSAGEDGLVMQFDLREPANCQTTCNHALINMNAHLGPDSEIKCLALNPARPEMMAVGANDHYVRVYDRRMLPLKRIRLHTDEERVVWDRSAVLSVSLDTEDYNFPTSAVQYYIAGHLPVKQSEIKRRYRPLTSTYLTFSPCGKDLLVNLGGEQIYLFDVNARRRSLLADFRKYFDALSPEMSRNGLYNVTPNGSSSNGFTSPITTTHVNGHTNGFSATPITANGFAKWLNSLSGKDADTSPRRRPELPAKAELLKQKANSHFKNENYNLAVAFYSEALVYAPRASVLYANRAAAYMKRDWDGDMYAALKDCYVTLLLEPENLKAHFRLAKCLYDLKQYKSAHICLEMFKTKYPNQATTTNCIALTNEIHNAIFENEDIRATKRKRLRNHSSHSDSVDNDDFIASADIVAPSTSGGGSAEFSSRGGLFGGGGASVSPSISGGDVINNVNSSSVNSSSVNSQQQLSANVSNSQQQTNFSSNNNNNNDSSSSIVSPQQNLSLVIGGSGLSEQECQFRELAYDYELRFCGHCNTTTDIKEANFFGCNGEYIIGGSDDGKFFIWDRKTCNIVRALIGDESIVNCLQPHPTQCLLASSGIDSTVKLWYPRPDDGSTDPRDVPDQGNVASENQRRMNRDPLETMLLNMGYRITNLMDVGGDSNEAGGGIGGSGGSGMSGNLPAVQCHQS